MREAPRMVGLPEQSRLVVCPLVTHRVSSQRQGISVVSEAKRTFGELRLQYRLYGGAA